MRILYVITGLGLGGAEKVVCDLADQMVLNGHNVIIAYLTGDKIVVPKQKNIEVFYLGLENISSIISSSFKYQRLIREFKPDIIHSHMVHANIFSRLNRTVNKSGKLICTSHNTNEGGKLRMLSYKYTNYLSNLNTNVSEDATRSLIKKGAFRENQVTTVYNGIDIDKFSVNKTLFNHNEIRFLSIGRFSSQKDYPNLLYSISKVRKTENIKFQIAGDGELRQEIEKLINELSLKEQVILLGNRDDIPNLLNQSDFFVLPSKHEGLPTVVIEAMACGCFVIATDCGGVTEIMGDTGIIVSPQDSDALARAIEQALSIPQENIKLNNERARKRVEALFSLESSVRNWLTIYNSI